MILGKVAFTFDKKVPAALAKGSLGAHVFEQLQGRPSCVLKKMLQLTARM